jgi:hypothetical protein
MYFPGQQAVTNLFCYNNRGTYGEVTSFTVGSEIRNNEAGDSLVAVRNDRLGLLGFRSLTFLLNVSTSREAQGAVWE